MNQLARKTLKNLLIAAAYMSIGGVVAIVGAYVAYVNARPDLQVWHEARLTAEYTADSDATTLADYLETEKAVFQQVKTEVVDQLEAADRGIIRRFDPGSKSNPDRWPQDWNRTFELEQQTPAAGILLLHGMSDSPYSLRHFGKSLHARGAYVLGLRIPGHGTAPSGLVTARWEDMAAAVRLAVKHTKSVVGDKPVYLVGYSNGGALSVQYAQNSLLDPSLPEVEGLILVSPAIGVSPAAAFAVWQARLGWLLRVEKLAWAGTQPEYDPFKYGSFAINAGDQAHRLTVEIRENFANPALQPLLTRFPRVLAFQSAVDATVSTPALIMGLFDQLPANGNELVLFDINRQVVFEELLANDPRPRLVELLANRDLPFSLTVLRNIGAESDQLEIVHKDPGDTDITLSPSEMRWPDGIFSLTHIALPFPRDDPLYGGETRKNANHVQLGNLALRGERGTIALTSADMLRQRWNPFWDFMDERVVRFTGLGQ